MGVSFAKKWGGLIDAASGRENKVKGIGHIVRQEGPWGEGGGKVGAIKGNA